MVTGVFCWTPMFDAYYLAFSSKFKSFKVPTKVDAIIMGSNYSTSSSK